MKRKTILILSSFVFIFTLYSVCMLFAQYTISNKVIKSIEKIIKEYTYIKNIEFSRITLSPLFFIDKKYYINHCFLKIEEIPSDLFINKISITDFIIDKGNIIPKFISTDKIEFFNLKKLKEQAKNFSPVLERSETILDYLLNSPFASFKADYQYGKYTGELNLFINNKLTLNTIFNLNDIFNSNEESFNKINLKSLKLHLENIPIDSKKLFQDNKTLLEILNEDYKNILLNFDVDFQKTTQSNENKPRLMINIDFQKIIKIKIKSNFYIENILKPEEYSINESSIQFIDHDFLDKYYKKEADKQNVTIGEIKKEAIKQNEVFLLFISNTALAEGIHEFNEYIMNPNQFTITIHPENPISIKNLKFEAKENYFGLLHFLKIKFKANSEIITQGNETNFH